MALGKYREWLEDDNLILLQGWARDGLTDEQIAHNMSINVSTLYDWKNKYSEIANVLKKTKEIVDKEVENALYKKAIGFVEVVRKPIKVKHIKYENGKRLSEEEKIEMVNEEVYIPPDTTAQIFWLKNRKPTEWRDKREVEANAETLEKLDALLGKIGGVE